MTTITRMSELRQLFEIKVNAYNKFCEQDKEYFEKDRDEVMDDLSEEFYIATRNFENGVDDILRKTEYTTRDVMDYVRMWKNTFKF